MMKSTAIGKQFPEPRRLVLILVLIAVVYGFLWPAVSGDTRDAVVPWLQTILTRGPIGAFSEPFSNYAPSYLYSLALVSPLAGLMNEVSVIKTLSVVATLLLVLAVRHLLNISGCTRNVELAVWVALLPSVAVNAAGFA